MSIGSQIGLFRRNADMTQAQLAEAVEVSFQAVSSWERDEYQPDIQHLQRVARTLHTTLGVLTEEFDRPNWTESERYFSEEHMYTFVKSAAAANGWEQTLRALPCMKKWHAGQVRKGAAAVPYIIHPLTMACHALAMGIADDELLAVILLHDVVEDCGVSREELPVSAEAADAVMLLSWPAGAEKPTARAAYYAGIAGNPTACIAKCLDRCNNLSTMAFGFTHEKMATYVAETETHVFPLLRLLKEVYVRYNSAAWLLSYQITSLLETYKRIL